MHVNSRDINELMERTSKVETADELKAIAAEHGLPITDEEVQMFFQAYQLAQGAEGELADDSLDVVSGGLRTAGGELVVTAFYNCDSFIAADTGNKMPYCRNCVHCEYKFPVLVCVR